MMLTPRREIISSLCEVHHADRLRETCYQFVNHQFQNLHPVIRFGIYSVGLLFLWQNRLTRMNVHAQMANWQNSKIGVLRDFIYFYESLSVLFIFESKPAEHGHE